MDDDEQVFIKFQDDALAEATDAANMPRPDVLNGRCHRAQDERTFQIDPLERLPDHALPQRVDVHHDIGQLRHLPILRWRASCKLATERVWLSSKYV